MKKYLFSIILLLGILIPNNVMAQEAYYVVSNSLKTVTFYYDDQQSVRTGDFSGSVQLDYEGKREWWSVRDYLTSAVFDSSFDNYRDLTSTAYWFSGCSKLSSITDIKYLHTENVTEMNNMFNSCSSLTEIDLSHFDTGKVQNFYGMFYQCSQLTSLDVSTFSTANATSLGCMFDGCSKLTGLNVSNFITANVTDMNRMFAGCAELTVLDLSSFNTANVTNMLGMFNDCTNLVTIYVGDGWSTAKATGSYDPSMFYGCVNLVGGQGFTYDASKVDKNYAHIDGGASNPGYFTDKNANAFDNRMLALWRQVDGKDYKLYTIIDKNDYRTNADGAVFNRTKIVLDIISSNDTTSVVVDPGEVYIQQKPYEAWMMPSMMIDKTNNRMYIFTHSKAQETGYRMDGYCYVSSLSEPAFSKEEVFDGNNWGWYNYFVGVNDSGLPKLSFFSYAGYCDFMATRLEDGTWQNENIGDIAPGEASARWQTVNKVTVVGSMEGDEVTLDNITYTLRGDQHAAVSWVDDKGSLTEFTVPETITVDGKTLGVNEIAPLAFAACGNMKQLTIPASVIRIGEGALARCNALEHVYVGNATPPAMANDYDSELIQFYNANTDNSTLHVPARSADRYRNVEGWKLFSNIEEEEAPSEPYAVLSDNDDVVTNRDGTKVKGKTLTFYYDKNKTDNGLSVGPFIDYSQSWYDDRERVTSVVFDESFANCTSITSTAYWFLVCTNLTNITGIENLNTANVTDMGFMFAGCPGLTSLNLSSFKTDKVTAMTQMFYGCSGLTNLDLTNFNTENVTDMMFMFWGCSELATIYAGSNWKTGKVTNGSDMFEGCTKLVGGAGTYYDENHTDHTYARIDGGPDNPGYFTRSGDAPYVPVEATFDGKTLTVGGELTMDAALEEVGGISKVAVTVAAIVWNSSKNLTDSDLKGISNPNLLIYVSDAKLAPSGFNNVVVNGVAKNIKLTDGGSGNYNFHAPQEFRVDSISYSREFKQATQDSISRGWEGIALPFTVQTFTHEEHGNISPFGNDACDYHFWLRQPTRNGVVSARTIEANKPYIISMPNSEEYEDEFNQAGWIKFAAANVKVPVTETESVWLGDSAQIAPTFVEMAMSSDTYVLNVGDSIEGHPEGSIFVSNYRKARPFEVYTFRSHSSGGSRIISLSSLFGSGKGTTDMGIVTVKSTTDVWYDLNGRRLQSKPTKSGLYIHNGKKEFIRR